MTVASMTGFARVEGAFGQPEAQLRWFWEVRSVNARGLDLRFRLPQGYEGLEPAARVMISERFKRGSLTAGLNLSGGAQTSAVRLNRAVLAQAMAAIAIVRSETDAGPPSADGILSIRGVLESESEAADEATLMQRDTAILTSLSLALDRLAAARADEGRRLAHVLNQHVDEIASLAASAKALAAAQPAALRERITRQVADLQGAGAQMAPERLAQELALLAVKLDVREELDRLDAHVAQARSLLASPEAAGRRLDFLSQEFNREANTLCSKSNDLELTRTGLALKAVIDQFREQIQNVE